MKKITAIIPTFNEEKHIAAAIESVEFADEIIVVDSFSTDSTVAIAQDKDVKVVQHEYIHSAAQKNWIIPQASHEWIVLLDADERVPPELGEEILEAVNSGEEKFQAYWIGRKNYFLGKRVRFSGWQGDRVIRLFKRDRCRYEDKNVHAEIQCDGKVGRLSNSLIHYTCDNIFQYLEKWDRYTTWGARDRVQRVKKVTLFHYLVKPVFRFVKNYFFRGGILDGKTGLIICCLSGMSVFIRSLKLNQLLKDQ